MNGYGSVVYNPQKLVDRRIKCKLNQEQLSYIINCSVSALSNWERGKTTPSAENIIKLSFALNVPADYFFDYDEHMLKLERNTVSDSSDISSLDIDKASYLKENIEKLDSNKIDIVYTIVKNFIGENAF